MNIVKKICSLVVLLPLLFLSTVILAQTDNPVSDNKKYSIYFDEKTGDYLKPVINVVTGLFYIMPENPSTIDGENNYQNRMVTGALGRFGFEGKDFGYVSYKCVLERNVGEYGSSIWDGTAMLSIRELYVKIEKWHTIILSGVFIDPASVDFYSEHMKNTLLTDQYTRDPLVYSGYNRAQGIMIQHKFDWLMKDLLTIGFSFTSGNPLGTSTSAAVGGKITNYSNVYLGTLRNLDNKNEPTTNLQFMVYTPSVILKTPKVANSYVEVRGAAQFFLIDTDKRSKDDVNIKGHNYRVSVGIDLLNNMIKPFFNYSKRENEQIEGTDITTLSEDKHKGDTISFGCDYNIKDNNGIGAYYSVVTTNAGTHIRLDYLNIGGTYWLEKDKLAIGLRYSKLVSRSNGEKVDNNSDDNAYYITLRLMI